MNYIDLLAVLPFYIKLVYSDMLDLRFFRVVRLARILRAIPSPKVNGAGEVIYDLFREASSPLFAPLFFMCLGGVICGSGVYYAEKTQSYQCEMPDGTLFTNWTPARTARGNEGCQTEYGCLCPGTLYYVAYDGVPRSSESLESIPRALWWCVTTFTTVGYGEFYPATQLGRGLAAVTMFVGIFFLAMPLSIIGGSFALAWERMDARAEELEMEKEKARAAEQRAEAHISDIQKVANPMIDGSDELVGNTDPNAPGGGRTDESLLRCHMYRLTALAHVLAANVALRELEVEDARTTVSMAALVHTDITDDLEKIHTLLTEKMEEAVKTNELTPAQRESAAELIVDTSSIDGPTE